MTKIASDDLNMIAEIEDEIFKILKIFMNLLDLKDSREQEFLDLFEIYKKIIDLIKRVKPVNLSFLNLNSKRQDLKLEINRAGVDLILDLLD